MTITWTPKPGLGYWYKGKLIGDGMCYDENNNIIHEGKFNTDGNLEDSKCTTIDYSDPSNVSVRYGVFLDGKENGSVVEYVFNKGLWTAFGNGANVPSTRYTHNFVNGVWSETTATTAAQIRGNFTKTRGKWATVSFEET